MPDPCCSWEGHSGGVNAGVGDESTMSRKVVQPLRLPLVIRPVHRTGKVGDSKTKGTVIFSDLFKKLKTLSFKVSMVI